jgi:hypothetical protein
MKYSAMTSHAGSVRSGPKKSQRGKKGFKTETGERG